MKTILALACLTILAGGCKEPSLAPSSVLDGMFTAMKSGNIDEMKKFITKSDIALLDAAEKIMTNIDPAGMKKIKEKLSGELKENANNIKYSFKKEKIDGDHASVEAEIFIAPSPGDSAGKSTTHTFELVKENNAWKIALSKPGNEMFNSMKGNMGGGRRGLKDGVEKLQKMDPDSLKMIIGKGLQALDSLDAKKN